MQSSLKSHPLWVTLQIQAEYILKYLKYKVSAHGIPDDHIIVMMYDDIANNKENPTPGTLIIINNHCLSTPSDNYSFNTSIAGTNSNLKRVLLNSSYVCWEKY